MPLCSNNTEIDSSRLSTRRSMNRDPNSDYELHECKQWSWCSIKCIASDNITNLWMRSLAV